MTGAFVYGVLALANILLLSGVVTNYEGWGDWAAELAVEAGADFVKTSTGLGPHGATVEDVRLLRGLVPSHIGVKAAGGIRTLEQVRAMVAAGADRIGTSSTRAIAEELSRR